MKILLLMRHGKASWKDIKKDNDKIRPLTKKGEKDAHKMSELVVEKGIFPQVILTSTAVRARETANVFLARCCEEITFIVTNALYMAEPPAILDVLTTLDDRVEKIMVIGHNPGLESVLQHLTGEVESLPTASIAYMELSVDHWADLSLDTQVEKWEKWRPKDA